MKKNHYLIIFFLGFGIFGLITLEMGIIGVLPQVADKFNIPTSQAGILVSVFAFIVAISGPFLTLLSSGINRKVILLTSILIFALSNIVYALTSHFEVMLIFRIIPALFHPVFLSVALATASQIVPEDMSLKAVNRTFLGLSAGFAFGIPITSYFADKISLESSFIFGAIISLITFFGVLIWLPSIPGKDKTSFGNQLNLLRKIRVWVANFAVALIHATMFAVYSYFAEFLGQVTHMNGTWISIMLLIFGVMMIAGNFIFGNFLQKNMRKTIIIYPLVFAILYLSIYFLGSHTFPMVILILIWGILHSGGIIISQSLLMAESKKAPEFGNSLYVSFSNGGIALGPIIGGSLISYLSISQISWGGIICAILSLLSILTLIIFPQKTEN